MTKVLIACEESQTVCKAFRAKGIVAYSCDLQNESGGHPDWHIQGDALTALYSTEWDLVIAHPPCTRLANSGVSWLAKRNLWNELEEGCKFFKSFQDWQKETGVAMAIENPIPHKYAVSHDRYPIGKYNQIIQPWQFGHGETKATCLWLYNLPKLKPTNIVDGREQRLHFLPPGPNRAKERSKTFQGIADAMADQWGTLL